jgi:hypothetical protein
VVVKASELKLIFFSIKREIFVLACLLGWFIYFLPFFFFLVFCRAVG